MQDDSGGVLTKTKYMLSLTLNAPKTAFNDTNQWFFEGKGLDGLFWPMPLDHMLFDMQSLPIFACVDVMKNPIFEDDSIPFESHLNQPIARPPSG